MVWQERELYGAGGGSEGEISLSYKF
jgi:hypothetical protein